MGNILRTTLALTEKEKDLCKKIVSELKINTEINYSNTNNLASLLYNNYLSDNLIVESMQLYNYPTFYSQIINKRVFNKLLELDKSFLKNNDILLSESQNLFDIFDDTDFEKYKDKLNCWGSISSKQKLSEEFIEKYSNYLNWTDISLYQKLSPKFIEKYTYKLDLYLLNYNFKIMDKKKRMDLIKDFGYECFDDYFIGYLICKQSIFSADQFNYINQSLKLRLEVGNVYSSENNINNFIIQNISFINDNIFVDDHESTTTFLVCKVSYENCIFIDKSCILAEEIETIFKFNRNKYDPK